jgi:diguanylate cyclase (GGDEF)-like protein
VLLADIDHFKQFNDQYGHECGDLVLKEVANLMSEHTRNIDHVARWGGEEFLLLLPGTDLEGAKDTAERIRRRIELHPLDHKGQELSVTVTLGATVSWEGEAIKGCISRADAALYKGKRSGRNRIEVLEGRQRGPATAKPSRSSRGAATGT